MSIIDGGNEMWHLKIEIAQAYRTLHIINMIVISTYKAERKK